MNDKFKKVAIFLIAIFLILSNFPQNIIFKDLNEKAEAAAPSSPTGSAGKVIIPVQANPIERNPGTYWYQQDSLKFRADFDNGSYVIADNVNNTPKTTAVKDSVDLTKFAMPTSYSGTNGESYSANMLDKIYLKNNSVKFVRKESFEGISLAKTSDTKVDLYIKTGNDYKFTKREQYGKNPSGKPKHTVRYDTPVNITWYGEITLQAEMRVLEDSTLQVGKTKQYKAQVRTKEGKAAWSAWKDVSAATWKSDKASVATVSNSGMVKAVEKGQAQITATWKDDNFHLQASANVTVSTEPFVTIEGKLNACLSDGSLTLKGVFLDGTSKDMTDSSFAKWTSSDTSIATVAKGVVSFKKAGTVNITFTYANKSHLVKVTIQDCSSPEPDIENEPPIVDIEGELEVELGQNVCYLANASDPDGYITSYAWAKGNFVATDTTSSTMCGYFSELGNQNIGVTVSDNGDVNGENIKSASDTETIKVVAPKPSAYVSVTGTIKENRKMVATPADAYGGNELAHQKMPIVKQTLTIEAVDSVNAAKVKIDGDISGNAIDHTKRIPFLAKFAGEVKITRYVENSAGESDTFETIINVAPDELPIVDFDTSTLVYRELEENEEYAKAKINIQNNSYSKDGDYLNYFEYTIAFDSKNNASYEDIFVIKTSDYEPNKYYEISINNNFRFKIKIDEEYNLEILTPYVGKTKVDLLGFEKFGQETIEKFVDQSFNKDTTDLRFKDTAAKVIEQKVVEVDNLAPFVSFDVQKEERINLDLTINDDSLSKNELVTMVNDVVKPQLTKNGIKYDLTVKKTDFYTVDNSKAPELYSKELYKEIPEDFQYIKTIAVANGSNLGSLDRNYEYYLVAQKGTERLNIVVYDEFSNYHRIETHGKIPSNSQGILGINGYAQFSLYSKPKNSDAFKVTTNKQETFSTIISTKDLTTNQFFDIYKKVNKSNAHMIFAGKEQQEAPFNEKFANYDKKQFIKHKNLENTLNIMTEHIISYYINQSQSENSVKVEVLLDENSGIDKAALQQKLDSILKATVAPSEIVIDNVEQPDGTFKEVERVQESSTVIRSKITTLTDKFNFEDVRLDGKNRFVLALKTNGYSDKIQTHIKATNLVNNAHFIGLGASNNASAIDNIVKASMKKGTYIEYKNLDDSLKEVANYILKTVDESRGVNEMYVTTDDEVNYFTNYNDYEKDALFDDYWKFKHDLGYFESENGKIAQHDAKIKTAITKFAQTGRYQSHYAAQDDPLTPVFASEDIDKFINYRKWSDEADNWYTFVHKMPSSDFTFTINPKDGEYTVTSLGIDIDKATIDVGYGAGLQSQEFTWKLEDDYEWQEGLPPGKLQGDVIYEVRNTVIDFQGKKSSTIKQISKKNLPPVAIFETDKDVYEAEEDVVITNKSYDPNDDDLTSKWYIKEKGKDDSTFKQFAKGGEYKDGVYNENWHPTIKKLACDNAGDEDCSFIIKLVVEDEEGLMDETTREIKVLNPEILDIGIKSVEIYTAPAAKGLPVYLELGEEILIKVDEDRLIDARNAPIQIDIYRDGKLHQTHTATVASLKEGHMFTILPKDLLEKDTEYKFEFELSTASDQVIINPAAERISLKPRTAVEGTIYEKETDFEFEGLVSVKKSLGEEQINTYEKINVNTKELKPTVTGLGHELDQTFKYDLPINRHYKSDQVFKATSQLEFDSVLIDSYFDGIRTSDELATVDTIITDEESLMSDTKEKTKVTMSYPKVFVEKKTGHVFSERQKSVGDGRITEELIDGGHKLYTPIWLDRLDKYDINYSTNELGVNKVKFVVTQELDIEAYMFVHIDSKTKHKDKWLMEPVNKKKPFPDGLPKGWHESDIEWLMK